MYSITMKCRPDALVQAGVEDLHDVRVHQTRRGLRLALEARHERRVLGEVLGEQLDRHPALQAQVEREVHGGHPAEAEPALQAVAPGDLHLAHWPLALPAGCARARARLRRGCAARLICRFPGRRPRPCPPRAPPARAAFTADAGAAPGPLDAPGAFASRRGVPPPGSWRWGSVVVGVVGVVVVRCGLGSSGVVWVLVVVVVVLVFVVEVVCGSGCVHSSSARRAGSRCPSLSLLRRPASTVAGSAAKSCFGFLDRGFGGGAVAVAALRRLGDRFEVALQGPGVGASGSGPCRSCRRRRAGRRDAEQTGEQDAQAQMALSANGGPLVDGCGDSRSLTVLQALGERVRQARRADRGGGAGDVVVGAPEARPSGRRGPAAARRRAGLRRVAARRCRD